MRMTSFAIFEFYEYDRLTMKQKAITSFAVVIKLNAMINRYKTYGLPIKIINNSNPILAIIFCCRCEMQFPLLGVK